MVPAKGDPNDPKTKALKHVCSIIGLDDDGFEYLHKYCIRTVERMVSTSNARYLELIKADPSVINPTEIDQIEIFRSWFIEAQRGLGKRVTPDNILKMFDDDEWGGYSVTYVADAINKANVATAAATTHSHGREPQQLQQAAAGH